MPDSGGSAGTAVDVHNITSINTMYTESLHQRFDLFSHFTRLWPEAVHQLASTETSMVC